MSIYTIIGICLPRTHCILYCVHTNNGYLLSRRVDDHIVPYLQLLTVIILNVAFILRFLTMFIIMLEQQSPSSLGSRSVTWLGEGLSMPSPR